MSVSIHLLTNNCTIFATYTFIMVYLFSGKRGNAKQNEHTAQPLGRTDGWNGVKVW